MALGSIPVLAKAGGLGSPRVVLRFKILPSAVVVALLGALGLLLWRVDRHLAPMAELARLRLVDREEARAAAQARAAVVASEAAQAQQRERELAAQKAGAEAAEERRRREEEARLKRLGEPVMPGETVEEIRLDNAELIRGASVVAVQATSVSFRAGSRLYNVPVEQLPEELRLRVRRMFPSTGAGGAPAR